MLRTQGFQFEERNVSYPYLWWSRSRDFGLLERWGIMKAGCSASAMKPWSRGGAQAVLSRVLLLALTLLLGACAGQRRRRAALN